MLEVEGRFARLNVSMASTADLRSVWGNPLSQSKRSASFQNARRLGPLHSSGWLFAVLMFFPQRTMTRPLARICLRALSFQSAEGSLMDQSAITNGVSEFFAWPTSRSFNLASLSLSLS